MHAIPLRYSYYYLHSLLLLTNGADYDEFFFTQFYGPQNIHPDTTFNDLVNTRGQDSSTPYIENQSLYWHPTIYRVTQNQGTKTYTRVSQLESSPYYRWDNSVLPKTEAFPPGFRMIAYSNQQGANVGGETGGNMFVECCNFVNDEESCTNTVGTLEFPTQACDFLGLAFAMPTCWNGELGIEGDHISHMAYTEDGYVAGACPPGFNRRLPQVQLFVRIAPYLGGEYVTSDESDVFHVDFMNGWQDGVLQNIIDNCPVIRDGEAGYNPPCNCAEEFLTENENPSGLVCDNDVRRYIVNEATDVVNSLPRGTCQLSNVITKSWDVDPPFVCDDSPIPAPVPTPTAPNPTPTPPTSTPAPVAPIASTPAPIASTPAPIVSTSSPVTSSPPTGTEGCSNSPLRFRTLNGLGKRVWRDCTWVENKPYRCNNDELATHCPVTCGVCDDFACDDSPLRFKLVKNGRRIARDCGWVGTKQIVIRCGYDGVTETCPSICDDRCSEEDGKNIFE